MSAAGHDPDRCAYVVGEDGMARLRGPHAEAWTGLQRAHRELTRRLEAALEQRHGLSLSSLELLGRLAAVDGHHERLARLAEAVGLSLSRVSRIIDALERCGLVERRPCPEDTRATEAWLTGDGLELAHEAQATHLAEVQRHFLDHVSPDELRTLGAVFVRLTDDRT
jgi:DNA-binding MarR family transcriptional regulator